jgi:hypothetical protein
MALFSWISLFFTLIQRSIYKFQIAIIMKSSVYILVFFLNS